MPTYFFRTRSGGRLGTFACSDTRRQEAPGLSATSTTKCKSTQPSEVVPGEFLVQLRLLFILILLISSIIIIFLLKTVGFHKYQEREDIYYHTLSTSVEGWMRPRQAAQITARGRIKTLGPGGAGFREP